MHMPIALINKTLIQGANFVFSIYDFDGNNTADAVNLGDMLRALNLNPTLATIEKLGGTKKKGKLPFHNFFHKMFIWFK